MKRVTGIGGIFFKSKNPKALGAWYKTHLGIDVQSWGGAAFEWNGPGTTAWNLFPADAKKFTPGTAPFMMTRRASWLSRRRVSLRQHKTTSASRSMSWLPLGTT